ncbi:sensor domain-containing diguanylate cyclase [Quadrisphaera sp. DSM 44207]|uniref:sensor domain-containing diguanylate cyclase n=1 Tax=Quadrisphaera sp. DSM 44207 TaxID=1881057 RepID=UPI00088EDC69|nr:sensor domain-containing diguanylate cyclase [Quadrisphaera sp. DSM 44207]SDQ15720.1 diguanylate cyclase (GGDEF) domain-containing protein [Quadrisphaera sp. DSM 44207]
MEPTSQSPEQPPVLAVADDAGVRGADLAPVGPWNGFAEAADGVLALLQARLGMELWAVTRVREDHQEVLVARSTGFPIPAGAVLPWAESYCARMVAGAGPRVAPRARREPAYAAAEFNARFKVGAYVGVPLLDEDGRLFGTLCALSSHEQPATLAAELPLVELLARQLSTLLSKERLAAERSAAAAAAYALAERDGLTGLLNRRGWDRAVEAEEQRCARHGTSCAVAVLDLDDLKAVNDARGHEAGDELLLLTAKLLETASRPPDHVARIGGDEFALIATEAAADDTAAWTARLQRTLHAAGVAASIGAAAREGAGTVRAAWRVADDAMYADKQARAGSHRG